MLDQIGTEYSYFKFSVTYLPEEAPLLGDQVWFGEEYDESYILLIHQRADQETLDQVEKLFPEFKENRDLLY